MTKHEMRSYGIDKVTDLFDRCWKMYEDVGHCEMIMWHRKHPDMRIMVGKLKILSDFYWHIPVAAKPERPFRIDMNRPYIINNNHVFELRSKSFEELEIKLSAAGY